MQPGIDPRLELGPFFHDELKAGKDDLGVDLSPEAEVYAVQLLVRYATLEVDVALHKPLALQWADAAEIRDAQARRHRFLRLGDAALLRAGFLREPDDRTVSEGYLCSMGQGAYIEVARLSNRAASSAFELLAEAFDRLCRVMREIRLRYARWDIGTIALVGEGSPAAAKRLGAEGLVLVSAADA